MPQKNDVIEENEKYRKKKPSSVSQSKAKSKHKHAYKDCLLVEEGRPHKAAYCNICGKINDVKFFESKKCENGYKMLSKEEVFEKYKDMKIFKVDSIFQKYIGVV